MSLTFGFYNSVNGDRRYDAVQMSSLFDGIIRDGVFMSIGDKLMVTANTGMSVVVGSGRAWFDHTWTNNDAPFALEVPASEVLLNRMDAVVLEVNSLSEVRGNAIKIVKGTPASSPAAPIMVNTTGVRQYPLAYLYVPALATTVTQGNITNKVGSADCPFITGVLSVVNTEALIVQWGAQWTEWINATKQAEDIWTADKHAEFLAWMATSEADYDSWEGGRQAEFLAWFNSMQATLTTEVAGDLAQEIYDLKILSSMGGMY